MFFPNLELFLAKFKDLLNIFLKCGLNFKMFDLKESVAFRTTVNKICYACLFWIQAQVHQVSLLNKSLLFLS